MREPSRVGLGIARSRESSRRRAWFASALSIVYMGLGQLYNGELAKGFLFALYHTVILTFAVPRLLRALEGLVTLGTMEGKDNSVFLLAQGLLGVIVGGSLLVFYVLGAVDAFVVARNKAAYQATRSSRAPARTFRAAASPYICLLPALILVALTVVFPLLFGMSLAFTSYDLYNSPPARLFQWVGLLNFKEIFQIKSWRGTFASVLNWTVVWAILSTFTCFAFGLLLAILLNNPKLRFRAVIRTILILPWAIPGFISTLMWGGLLNTSFGPVNLFLQRL
ncbi:MAG: sugar ABC transporter permease, partial [Bacillota bacterium]